MTAGTTILNLIELPVLAACGVSLAAAFLVGGIILAVALRIVSWILEHIRGVSAVSCSSCGFLVMTCLYMTPCALAQSSTPNQTMPTVITCTSTKGQRQVCKADTAAGVALLRSTGESNCLLGNTWGYDSAGVWVSDGCGGDFALGGT